MEYIDFGKYCVMVIWWIIRVILVYNILYYLLVCWIFILKWFVVVFEVFVCFSFFGIVCVYYFISDYLGMIVSVKFIVWRGI